MARSQNASFVSDFSVDVERSDGTAARISAKLYVHAEFVQTTQRAAYSIKIAPARDQIQIGRLLSNMVRATTGQCSAKIPLDCNIKGRR
jgi:hypothetical protein